MLDNSCSSTAAVAHHFTWAAAAGQTEFIYRPLGLPSSIIPTLNQRDDLDSSVNNGTSQSHLSVSMSPSNFLSTIIGSSATTIHGTATQVCQFVSLPPSADVIDRVEHFNTDSRSENYSNKLLQDYCNGTTTTSLQPHFSTPGISGIESMVPASSGWNSTIPTMKYQSSPSRFHELTAKARFFDEFQHTNQLSRRPHVIDPFFNSDIEGLQSDVLSSSVSVSSCSPSLCHIRKNDEEHRHHQQQQQQQQQKPSSSSATATDRAAKYRRMTIGSESGSMPISVRALSARGVVEEMPRRTTVPGTLGEGVVSMVHRLHKSSVGIPRDASTIEPHLVGPEWANLIPSINLQPRISDHHQVESSTISRFQYILCAATSPAVKLDEEQLTYLNQGQSYEIKLKRLCDTPTEQQLTSIIRVVFHERRLQYVEREQLEHWKKLRPGERFLEIDVPISYGITDAKMELRSLNSIEVSWNPNCDAGVFIKVNCISTEFTARKHGGEKGVPFRIQLETYASASDNIIRASSDDTEKRLLHCASCQIKVFKV